jgi:hypothetical protein
LQTPSSQPEISPRAMNPTREKSGASRAPESPQEGEGVRNRHLHPCIG